jgi:hypothetical protein
MDAANPQRRRRVRGIAVRAGIGALALAIIAVIVKPAMAFACMFFGCVDRTEVARTVSPDKMLDAVTIETDGGAMTSFGYGVRVVPHGGKWTSGKQVAYVYAAARNKVAWGVTPDWVGARSLTIKYMEARSARVDSVVKVPGFGTIHTVLLPGVVDSTAPAGGMELNLRRR